MGTGKFLTELSSKLIERRGGHGHGSWQVSKTVQANNLLVALGSAREGLPCVARKPDYPIFGLFPEFGGYHGSGVNENPSPPDRLESDSVVPAFRGLFTTGVFGWLVGMGVLFGASWVFANPESVPVALLWAVSHWWIAFLFGLLLMAVRGLVAGRPMARAVLAYLLPVVILLGVARLCLLVYPDSSLRGDLFTYLPVVLVFHLFGCLWMSRGREAGESPAFLRAVIPSLTGGLIVLGFAAVPAFASDGFRYRNAFELGVDRTTVKDGVITSEGTLSVHKPGTYEFAAPRYVWDVAVADSSSEPEIEMGEIQWGAAGAPKAGETGVYAFKVVWRKGVTPGGVTQLPPYEDSVLFEVRRPDEGGRIVHCVSSPMALAP